MRVTKEVTWLPFGPSLSISQHHVLLISLTFSLPRTICETFFVFVGFRSDFFQRIIRPVEKSAAQVCERLVHTTFQDAPFYLIVVRFISVGKIQFFNRQFSFAGMLFLAYTLMGQRSLMHTLI
jgi:hypothetical protein